MKQWGHYEPFKVPMNPEAEALLLAALKRDPTGPWVTYLSMRFAEATFKARMMGQVERAATYKAALGNLKPALETLRNAAKVETTNKQLIEASKGVEELVMTASLEAGVDLDAVKASARTMLAGNTDLKSWNYGNLVYQANSILGRVALREGRTAEAKDYLIAAGNTPGSPQLNSFGPDFILARELLEKRENAIVLRFLDLVERFMVNSNSREGDNDKQVAANNLKKLEVWRDQIRGGKVPDDLQWH